MKEIFFLLALFGLGLSYIEEEPRSSDIHSPGHVRPYFRDELTEAVKEVIKKRREELLKNVTQLINDLPQAIQTVAAITQNEKMNMGDKVTALQELTQSDPDLYETLWTILDTFKPTRRNDRRRRGPSQSFGRDRSTRYERGNRRGHRQRRGGARPSQRHRNRFPNMPKDRMTLEDDAIPWGRQRPMRRWERSMKIY